MIKVTFRCSDEAKSLCLTVQGHAGQAEYGHDLICASASILAYTLAHVVMTMEHHGDLEDNPTIALESGEAVISFRCKSNDIYAEASHAFFVVKAGYALLARDFPQYVELITVGEADSRP